MIDEKDFTEILDHVYKISGKFISGHEDRQDLAQIVGMKYFLNKDDIKFKKSWLYSTTKNAAADLYKDRKKKPEGTVDFEKIENQITSKILDQSNSDDPLAILKKFEMDMSKPERELLTLYAKESFQIKKIARRKRTNYEALKKKIYRLKAEIRAKYNLDKGMKGTRKIFGAKLNENLLNFFHKFKQALETNSLDSMSIYFRDCEIPAEYPHFKIHKVHGYDVRLLDDDKYDIFFYYFEPDDTFRSAITTIQVYNKNSIKVVKFPRLPTRMTSISLEGLPEEIVEMLEYNEQGVPKLSQEELQKLLEKHGIETTDIL